MRTKSVPSITGSSPLSIGFASLAAAASGALVAAAPSVGAAVLTLAGALVMATRPYWVVLFLTVYMPFENLILKFLPGSDQLYFAARFVSEMLIYLAFAVLVCRKMLSGASFRKTPIDTPLLLFVGIAIVSTVVNRSPLAGSLLNLRSFLRYVLLFYLVVNLDLSPRQVTRLLKFIVVIGLAQVLIGFLQSASNGAINEFLMPRQTNISAVGRETIFRLGSEEGREVGSIFGTLGDTIYFGFFLMTALAVFLGRLGKLNARSVLFIAAIILAVMFSYARAIAFGTLLMLSVFYWQRYGLARIAAVLLVPILLLGVMGMYVVISSSVITIDTSKEYVNPVEARQGIIGNLTGIVSRDYFQRAQAQRLGSLIGVGPTILVNKPILGYGPDEITTIERLNESNPSFLLYVVEKEGFEDVYWVAILAYYGLVGLCALVFLLYRLYTSAQRIRRTAAGDLARKIALSVIYLTAVAPFLLFFYRTLEFRIYSFYFWLLPALMFGLIAWEHSSAKTLVRSS